MPLISNQQQAFFLSPSSSLASSSVSSLSVPSSLTDTGAVGALTVIFAPRAARTALAIQTWLTDYHRLFRSHHVMLMMMIMDLSSQSDSDRSCSRKSRGTHTPSCTGLQGTNIMAMIRWIMMIMIMRKMMGTSTHLYCRRARSSGYGSCRFRRRNQNFHDQNSREDNCCGR